jgi:hypothetical protein
MAAHALAMAADQEDRHRCRMHPFLFSRVPDGTGKVAVTHVERSMTPENASSGNGTVQLPLRTAAATSNTVAHTSGTADGSNPDVRRELAELQKQVGELDVQITAIRLRGADRAAGASDTPSLSQIVGSVATTILVGAIVRRLPLGMLGAAAAPLLAAQFNRRLWPALTGDR